MTTLLIDGNWLIKRNYHKRKNDEAKGVRCGGSFGFLDSLRAVISKILPDRVVVMWDGLDSGMLRYEVYKPYKSNRKKSWNQEKRALETSGLDSEEEKETYEIWNQKFVVKNFLEQFCIRHTEVDKIEADDLIAYYILSSKLPNETITIYSRDKDYLQLVSPTVSILNPDNFELITINNFKKIFRYTIENALLFKCFNGDKADKISGVNGVTPDKLLKLFPRMADEKYTYNRLVEECYNKKREKKLKIYDKIIEARSVLYRNAKLMNLKQPFLNQEAIDSMQEIIYCSLDSEKFSIKTAMDLFLSNGFNKFVKNEHLDLFFAPFYRIVNKEKEYNQRLKGV